MLPTLEGFEIVNINSIIYCEGADNFTKFHFEGGQPLLICRTLKYFEDILKNTGSSASIGRTSLIPILWYDIRREKGVRNYEKQPGVRNIAQQETRIFKSV